MRPIDADAMRKEWLENGENEYVYDTNAVLDSIDNQPTIEPPHWIPVTERLPEDPMERVLVKVKDANNIIGHLDMDTDRYMHDMWIRWGRYVTHWMPLPEPPKENEP